MLCIDFEEAQILDLVTWQSQPWLQLPPIFLIYNCWTKGCLIIGKLKRKEKRVKLLVPSPIPIYCATSLDRPDSLAGRTAKRCASTWCLSFGKISNQLTPRRQTDLQPSNVNASFEDQPCTFNWSLVNKRLLFEFLVIVCCLWTHSNQTSTAQLWKALC